MCINVLQTVQRSSENCEGPGRWFNGRSNALSLACLGQETMVNATKGRFVGHVLRYIKRTIAFCDTCSSHFQTAICLDGVCSVVI